MKAVAILINALFCTALLFASEVYPIGYLVILFVLFQIGLYKMFWQEEKKIDPLSNVQRLIIVGPSGSGKDHLRLSLHKMGYNVDIPYTTRPMREGETEGFSYNFISSEKFDQMYSNSEFVSAAKFNNAYYGITWESWLYSKIFIMSPNEAKVHAGKDSHIILFLNVEDGVRKGRTISRNDRGFDTPVRRVAEDLRDFSGFEEFSDIVITNPYFETEEIFNHIRSLE
jgi:hypothetical protein